MANSNSFRYRTGANHSELLGLSTFKLQPYDANADIKQSLEEMYHSLVLRINALNGPQVNKLNSRLAAVCYQLGRIYYDIEEDPAMAESMFFKARDCVEDHESEPDNIISAINSLNMLAYIKKIHNEANEEALQFLLEAEYVYQEYDLKGLGEATTVHKLLPNFPKKRSLTSKNPLISARLFSLFYIIEVYKDRSNITNSLISTHYSLRLQVDNNLFLQSPLDWALSSALIANLLCEQNAYQQARHHLAAASTIMEKIVPVEYLSLYNTDKYRQYMADISRCWARYGMRLLKKSKTRLMKQKTHKPPPMVFGGLFFKSINLWNEERVTRYYVNNYEDAQLLTNNILMNLNRTKKYYTFEKNANYYADLCMDTSIAYKLLSYFQDNPDKMGKLFKKGIVDLELAANRLNEENCMSTCRRIWYELGTVYSDMMDIKYERHVNNSLVLTEFAIKKINRYASLSIKYYTRFIESLYVQRRLPARVPEPYVKPMLLAHMHIARCLNKKIITIKNAKLEVLFKCKKYYQTVMNYCSNDPSVERMMPIEISSCRELLNANPTRIDALVKNKNVVRFYT